MSLLCGVYASRRISFPTQAAKSTGGGSERRSEGEGSLRESPDVLDYSVIYGSDLFIAV